MRIRTTCRLVCALVLGIECVTGCKKPVNSSAPPSPASSSVTVGSGSASSDGDHSVATGAGAVSASGNVVTYQNVHVQVPWDPSNPVTLMKAAQEAAAGKGLKLRKANTALEISSDGKTLHVNGQDYGLVHPGDRVVLSEDGKVTVNGQLRTPSSPATHPAG